MKVLVAPLDWGLGHATRCVPVIQEFLNNGAEVELAVVKSIASLYREIFPNLRQRLAPSYKIIYPKHGFNMGLWLLKNTTHLNAVMKYEHHYAEEMVKRHGYDVLFSDNRFGFYSTKAHSIYMTHQCRIAFPPVLSNFEGIGIKWHSSVMKHFNEVWIPDEKEFPGYAGELSHVSEISKSLKYVGILSRFKTINEKPKQNKGIVAIVSGVEPARSQFERQLRQILVKIPGNHIVVLGKPSNIHETWKENNIEFHNHLSSEKFAEVISRAEWVVSRGGYSTIMDMACLGAKCIFVPTPGQYEQTALGKMLANKGAVVTIPSSKFSVLTLMQAMDAKVKLPSPSKQNLLKKAVLELISSL